MKKSLIAVAVAGLFAAPAAMADVTISGAIATGLLYGKSSGGGANDVTRTSLASNYSHVDIESVDDIGNGNKVVFHLQLQVNIQDATPGANPFNRNSFLGIVGNWGGFKYGTNENVYERMQYSSDFMDGALGTGGNLMILSNPGVGTAFDAGQSGCGPNATSNCAGFYRRTDHTIWYESPNWNGFSFEVDYTLSAYKTPGSDPKVLSIGGKYAPEGMPFFVDVAYETHDDFGGINQIGANKGAATGAYTSTDDTGIQIGGGYTFGDWQFNARWERLTYEGSTALVGSLTEWERDAFWLGVKWNLPTGYAAVQYGWADEADCTAVGGACTAPDTGADHIGIGYFHNLSKQSQIQVIYNQTSNDANASYLAVGGTNVVNGADHKGLYVGIKHTF